MKTIFQFVGALALFLVAGLVAVATDNVVAGVVTVPVVTYGFQACTGYALFSPPAGLWAVLAPIPRTQQGEPNPGGVQRLYLIGTDQVVGEWPKRSLIVNGELATAPTLVTAGQGQPATTFVEVEISDNSAKLDDGLKGPTGYQSWEQALELKIAGFSKEQCAAIEKLLNSEVIAVARLNDGQRVVLGSSYMGLQFEITHTTGAKGSDRREWTLKAKQDGYMFGYVPLATTVTLPGVAAS